LATKCSKRDRNDVVVAIERSANKTGGWEGPARSAEEGGSGERASRQLKTVPVMMS